MKLTNLDMANNLSVEYEITHTVPGKDDVVASLVLDKSDNWSGMITFNQLASGDSPAEVAKKLGERLFRLAESIAEDGDNFNIIDLTTVSIKKS